jgi:ectoine hydroxylase-related dioxygenase (phytanoyl-CoA dioxygenase family)
MDIEKQIIKRMEDTGYTRLDAIASMDLGERSEAAERASQNRARRKELMDFDMSFETACLVVNQENERALEI